MKNKLLRFLLVLLASYTYNYTASIASYTLPLLVYSQGYGGFWVGVSGLLVNMLYVLVAPIAGRISDSIARRKPLVASGSLTLLLAVASMSSKSLALLLLASALMGVAGGLVGPNLTALAVDYGPLVGYEKPEKPIARLGFSGSLGWCTGLITAGLLIKEARQAIPLLLLASTASLASSLAVRDPPIVLERAITARPRPRPFIGVVERVKLAFTLLSNPPTLFRRLRTPFNTYLASIAMLFTGSSMFFTQLPVLLKSMGVSDKLVYWISSIHTIVSTIAYNITPRLSITLSPWRLLELAVAVRAAAIPLTLASWALGPLRVVPVVLVATGVTWAAISVSMSTIAVLLAEPGSEATALGQLNTAIGLGLSIGSIASGAIVASLGLKANYLIAPLVVASSIPLLRASRRALKNP